MHPMPARQLPDRRRDDDEYLHYVERSDEAHLVAEAFELQERENRLGGRSDPLIGSSHENL